MEYKSTLKMKTGWPSGTTVESVSEGRRFKSEKVPKGKRQGEILSYMQLF